MQAEPQSIDELRQRYTALNEKRIQAEAKLEQATREVERLKLEARTEYGTDDLEELRAKLQAMEADNLLKRRQYQTLLDRIEQDLSDAER